MSIKSIIACCKYQLYKMRLIPLFFVIYVFGSMLLSAIIISVIEKVPFSLVGAGSSGFDMLIGLLIFGFMCSFMADFLNTAAANGVSRTTACVSTFISSVICSIVSAIEISVIYPIVSFFTKNEEIWGASLYGHIISLQNEGWDMFSIRLRYFGICIFIFIALCSLGMLLASIVYKLPKWASALIIIAMIFIPTAGIYLTFGEKGFVLFWFNVFKFFGFGVTNVDLIGDPLQGAAMFLGLSLILLLLSCLITRHSSVKPLAIKTD